MLSLAIALPVPLVLLQYIEQAMQQVSQYLSQQQLSVQLQAMQLCSQ